MNTDHQKAAREVCEKHVHSEALIEDVAKAIQAGIDEAIESEREAIAKAICGGCDLHGTPELVDGILQHHRVPRITKDYWFPCSASAIRSRGGRV